MTRTIMLLACFELISLVKEHLVTFCKTLIVERLFQTGGLEYQCIIKPPTWPFVLRDS